MYYSATRAFGSSESRIWLAVSDRPEGPFENRGVVADTWGTEYSAQRNHRRWGSVLGEDCIAEEFCYCSDSCPKQGNGGCITAFRSGKMRY